MDEPTPTESEGSQRSGRVPEDQPTAQFGLAAGDHCANCGAALASDQRYCVNCGERRGKPRFTLAEPEVEPAPAAIGPAPPRRPRASSGFTFIAGVATLLLAMGVGVLIGHNSTAGGTPRNSNAPVNITLKGGGTSGASTNAASTQGSSSGGGGGSKSKHHKSKGSSNNAPSAAAAQKASAAASKVVGGGAPVAPATVTVGGSCSNGQAGCSGGHFSGNFFGGG